MDRQHLGLEYVSCFCMLFIFIVAVKSGATQESCPSFGGTGILRARGVPEIRFPFWIKDDDNHGMGYPHGFGLSRIRTLQNHTRLQLDSVLPAKMLVESIDYDYRGISLVAADGCFRLQLLHLNLSAASPFGTKYYPVYDPYEYYPAYYPYGYYPANDGTRERNVTLLSCPASKNYTSDSFHRIHCLGDRDHHIYALYPDIALGDVGLQNCQKAGAASLDQRLLPLLLPEISYYSSGRRSFFRMHPCRLRLGWSVPECQKCEDVGRSCKLKKNGTVPLPEIQCYGASQQSYGNSMPPPKPKKTGAAAKLKEAGCILGPLLLVLIGVAALLGRRKNKKEMENLAKIQSFLEDYRALKPTRYSYADIKRITKQFKEKVGQGGYGTVFKGNLSTEVTVAVKILNNTTGDGEEFINEVKTMGRIHHVNVVRLVGFCADGYRRGLVYEFLPNESLDKFIYSETIKKALGWKKLKDIALGTAKGIEYLHQGCEQRILHFDIKPHNVLLDANLNPKISDFGLAKLFSKEQSAVSITAARGTIGYIAPEVVSRNFGSVSHKSDVYSFGMLLVNMIEGKKNNDVPAENISQGYFPDWIYARLERGEVVGSGIDTAVDANIAKHLIVVGLSCIQWYPADRPSMKEVVQMLQGEGDGLVMPPNPFAPTNPTMGGTTQRGKDLNMELEVISEIE